MARLLGIDYGERRIGVALSDESATIATPLRVITVQGRDQAVRDVIALAQTHGAQRIIVGRPVRLDGGDGPAAEKALGFGRALQEAGGLPVGFWDERYSTRTAEQALIAGGARRNRRKQVVDKLAAQIILQHYLDAQAGLPELPEPP